MPRHTTAVSFLKTPLSLSWPHTSYFGYNWMWVPRLMVLKSMLTSESPSSLIPPSCGDRVLLCLLTNAPSLFPSVGATFFENEPLGPVKCTKPRFIRCWLTRRKVARGDQSWPGLDLSFMCVWKCHSPLEPTEADQTLALALDHTK